MYEEQTLTTTKLARVKEFFNANNSSWMVFGLIILGGIIARIFLINFTSSDIFVWKDAAELLLQGKNPYETTILSFQSEESKNFYAYMPLWLYICSLILLIFSDGWFFIVVKILIILCDLTIVFLLYLILQSKVTNVWRLKMPIALWFVTPLVIMTGAMHGKFDSLMFIFILAACYFYEKRKLFPEAIFLSLGILTKTIVLILIPFFLLRDIKERKFLNILYKIGLIVFPILLFSIPFLYDPIIYFQGILGVHITRGHDLAPLFALLSLPFSSVQADTIIRIILTVVIVLVWIGLIVLSYFKNWDIYASGFYAFLSFNFLYWVFLIQYTSWIYTFYTVHTTKSKLKHWQLGLLSGIIVVGSTILMGLMGLFIKNGL